MSESFLQRWSQRKQASRESPPEVQRTAPVTETHIADKPAQPLPELPPIESLQEDSEVSMFLREEVAEAIRRQALRKLFHMQKFNICDGLDDYAEDYTNFAPLGNVMTAYQRMQEERLAQARELVEEALQSDEIIQADTAESECIDNPNQREPQEG